MTDVAYKLVDQAEYDAADGRYSGSAVDRADGYIHLSTAGQLAETAARHFRGRDGLVLIAVNLPDLEDVRWEPSRGGALFPHLFGPLPKAAALWERSLSVDADGIMRFDDGATGWP